MAIEQLAYSTSAQMHLTSYCSKAVALNRPLGDKKSRDEMIDRR